MTMIFSDSFERISKNQASRFLNQATFGATKKDIEHLQTIGYENWLQEQFNLQPTLFVKDFIEKIQSDYLTDNPTGLSIGETHFAAWWTLAASAKDQLRHRIAFALSQFFVVSDLNKELHLASVPNPTTGILTNGESTFYDVLLENLDGNFRDLLEKITLDNAMGRYLNMANNQKGNPDLGTRPDENYAREILQLFSIGLVCLNQDGSQILGNDGSPIPTYTQEIVENFARIFTGWKGNSFNFKLFPEDLLHDSEEKILLNNEVIPAGKTCQEDLTAALNNIFAHPNIAPFVSSFLIKHLVTSNPTKEYISDVAAVFNNNGEGIKGDLKAVYKTILLHQEARNGHNLYPETFGKLREPMVRIIHIFRALKAKIGDMHQQIGTATYPDYIHTYLIFNYYGGIPNPKNSSLRKATSQIPSHAPSVFNFYSPEYKLHGEIRNSDLFSPEFQICSESQIVNCNNWLDEFVIQINNSDYFDINEELSLINNSIVEIINHLNTILMSGQMSYEMFTALEKIDQYESDPKVILVKLVRYIIQSPEYVIQK